MIRGLLEWVSRDVVVRRRLSREFGNRMIYVSPDSALRLWHPKVEATDPELVDIARRFVSPGTIVWDIGANVGLFSFCAAAKAEKVFSIEADGFLVSLLRRSALRNSANVTPIPVAISDYCGFVEFNIAERGRSANFVNRGMSEAGGVRRKEVVPCVTLDWLAEQIPEPDFIKLDVEGMENAVLGGGLQLLKRKHPRIFCEVSEDPESRQQTTELLRAIGYRLYNVKNDSWVEKAVWSTLAVFGDL